MDHPPVMRHRSLLALVVLLAVGAALVPALAQRPPVKIGLLAPITGPQAANGREMVNGLELFLEQEGSRLAGREVKLIVGDDESKPATGLTRLRGMVEGQGIHVVVGPLSAAVGYAVRDYIDAHKLPALFAVAAAQDITQRKGTRYITRSGYAAGQSTQPFGKWVYDELKYRKIAIIGFDFAFGWEEAAGFQRTFEEAGGRIVQKLWAPLGNADYSPYIAQLKRDADAVLAVFSGPDAVRFMRQYAEAGLRGRLPIIGTGTFTEQHVLTATAGSDEFVGVISPFHYWAALDTPANRKFVKAFEDRYKQLPSQYGEGTYTSGLFLKRALEAIGGDAENADRLAAAFRAVDLSDTPRGPIRLDEYGNPIVNIHVRKVERVGGRLQNTAIHTFPNVSQFWTYKPEEYLKAPVYSRDYPPCRFC
jgi:branched-chain amino acid transport system substrate-binding protein